jgi:hypothetical protein
MDLHFLKAFNWWALVGGLAAEVMVVVATALVPRLPLSEKAQKLFKRIEAWVGALAAILVLFAIIGEHHVGKIQEIEMETSNVNNEINAARVMRSEASNRKTKAELLTAKNAVDKLSKSAAPRRLSGEQKQKLFIALFSVPVSKLAIGIDPSIPDAKEFAEDIGGVLVGRGFTYVGADWKTVSGRPKEAGVSVAVNGDPNSPIADTVIKALISIGVQAHKPTPWRGSSIEQGSYGAETQKAGVLYIDIGEK